MKSSKFVFGLFVAVLTLGNLALAQPNSDIELVGRLEFDFTELIAPVYRDGLVFAGIDRAGQVGRHMDFVVYDVSNPERFRRVVRTPFTDDYDIRYLTLFGQYLVAFTWPAKTFLIDISNLNEIEISGPLNGLDVYGYCPAVVKDSLIFIPNISRYGGTNSQVKVARLANGPELSILSTLNIRGVMYGMSVRGNRLACAMNDEDDDNIDDNKLLLLDISDIQAVEEEGFLVHRPWAPIDVTTGFENVALSDEFLVSYNHSAYQIVDIRNPASPRQRLNFPSGTDRNNQILIEGTTAWMTGEGSLGKINVSDVTNPRIESTHFIISGRPHILSKDGSRFLFSHGYPYVEDGLSLQNLEDPDNPEMINHFSRNSTAEKLAVSGSIAAVGFSDGFAVLDVSNPNQPQEMSYKFASNLEGLCFNASGELIVHSRGQKLLSYDLTDIESPREINHIDFDSTSFRSIFDDDLCYFPGIDSRSGEEGVFVFDVSSGDQMHRIGYMALDYHYSRQLVITNHRLYIGHSNITSIIDITDPPNLRILGRANFENGIYLHAGYGNFLLGEEETNMNQETWVVQAEAVREDTLVKIPRMSFRPSEDEVSSITVAPDGGTFLVANRTGVTSYSIEWGHRPQVTGFYAVPTYSSFAMYGPSNDESSLIYVVDAANFLILEASRALGISMRKPNHPSDFSLSAFPNPFNSTVTISFATGRDARPTRLSIYDVNGRQVAEMHPPLSSPPASKGGKQSVIWDAAGMGNGIYFIKLETGNTKHIERVVLMK